MLYFKKKLFILITLVMMSCSKELVSDQSMVLYGEVPIERIKGFNHLITESAMFSKKDIELLKENNGTVYGYISLGEVSDYRYYYERVKPYTFGKNAIWDSYYLDLSEKEVHDALIDFLQKQYKKGIRNFFFDTIDTYGEWGPGKHLSEDLVVLMQRIRITFPDAVLIQNSGIDLLPRTHDLVDMVAIESIITNYDFDKNEYRLRDKAGRREKLLMLDQVKKEYELPVMLIEYTDSEEDRARIEKLAKATGHYYFIGNLDLQTFPKFH
jgi:uncharacterized protein (TIGR01370 family)